MGHPRAQVKYTSEVQERLNIIKSRYGRHHVNRLMEGEKSRYSLHSMLKMYLTRFDNIQGILDKVPALC